MKKLQLVLLFFSFTVLLKAQDGVFLTYEEFMTNKFVAADVQTLHYDFGKKGYVSIEQKGIKKKWKLDEIYAFRKDDLCWRALQSPDCKDGAAAIMEIGNFVFYMTRILVSPSENFSGYKYRYYISKDLTSKAFEFTQHPETLDALVEAQKEFAAMKEYLDKAKKGDTSQDIVLECIKRSPEYKIPDPLPMSKTRIEGW